MFAREGLMRAQVPARRWRIAASSMLAVVSMLVTTATLASDLSLATWNIAWLRERPLTDAEYQQCIAMPAKQRERLDERDLMRWVCRNSAHYAMLARIAARVDPDIIALQEIENVAAAALVFPPDRYQIVVTDSPWIQRVGFAVRKSAATIVKFVDYKALGGPISPCVWPTGRPYGCWPFT